MQRTGLFNQAVRRNSESIQHCVAVCFWQGVKNYTDVKLVLLYRLILETHIIFVRKNNFLSPSVYCPDTSKRVPRIVTATGTEWWNRFVRDWIESSQPKMSPRQITALHPQPTCSVYLPKTSLNFWKLFIPFNLYYILILHDRFRHTHARPADATHRRKALPAETVMV